MNNQMNIDAKTLDLIIKLSEYLHSLIKLNMRPDDYSGRFIIYYSFPPIKRLYVQSDVLSIMVLQNPTKVNGKTFARKTGIDVSIFDLLSFKLSDSFIESTCYDMIYNLLESDGVKKLEVSNNISKLIHDGYKNAFTELLNSIKNPNDDFILTVNIENNDIFQYQVRKLETTLRS